jgi:CubicO group peptidase (beta-lactamase class C family)
MQRYVDARRLPGIITAVMHDGDVIDFQTFGYLDVESERPICRDAIFRIYSNTKIVTSVAALMLLEQRQFGLDDPLHAYLPQLRDLEVYVGEGDGRLRTEPCNTPPTIRQLMSHSAGFVYGWDPTHPVDQAYVRLGVTSSTGTLADMVTRLSQIPLAYQPGSEWRYSVATDVLARLVEVVSGQRFDACLRHRIFEPLGMVDTDFHVPPEKQPRFMTNYRPGPDGLEKCDDPFDGQYSRPKPFLSGGGGLCGTVDDYLQFIGMLQAEGTWRGERLLRPETVRAIRTNVLGPGTPVRFNQMQLPHTGFGLGVAVRIAAAEGEPPATIGEYHWGGVAGTHSWVSPSAKLAGVCFTQLLPGFLHAYGHDFRRLAYRGAGIVG